MSSKPLKMHEHSDNCSALITLPDATLATTPEPKRVLSEMVDETLALARREPLFKIGEYEWCEPDFRQILLWAEALNMEPEEVIRRLLDERSLNRECDGQDYHYRLHCQTAFTNGRMVKISWDIELLPLPSFDWVEGLEIKYFRIVPQRPEPTLVPGLNLSLSELRELHCNGLGLHELDLSRVPRLEKCWCTRNRLADLNLSHTPLLYDLACEWNQITKLNLSSVPAMYMLCVDCNRLTDIDLSSVPKLGRLSCGRNKLTELDLSRVPKLMELYCSCNQLSELNLSKVPELNSLWCNGNELSELQLSGLVMLDDLRCDENPIDALDIRPLRNWGKLKYDESRTRLIQRPDQHF